MANEITGSALLQQARTAKAPAPSAPAPGASSPAVPARTTAESLQDDATAAASFTGEHLRRAASDQASARDPRIALLQRFGAAPAESGIRTPEDVTRMLTAGLPESVQPLVRAFGNELLEPTLRAAGPGLTGLPTKASVPERLMDAAGLGFAATPVGAGVTAAVMGTQTALDTVTGNPNLARALAVAGTAAISGAQAVRSVVRGVRAAKTTAAGLLKEATALPPAATGARLSAPEVIGSRLQDMANKALVGRKTVAQSMMDSAENAIAAAAPRVPVAALRGVFDDLNTASVRPLGTEAQAAWKNVKDAFETGQDVASADLLTLRRTFAKRSGYGVDTRFSSLSDSQELVRNFRQGVADTLEANAPSRFGENYKAARLNYRVNYIQQRDAVKGLLDPNVTARQAFDRVFSPTDTQAMRTVTEITNANPKLALATRGKLRQGFIEALGNDAGDLVDARQARKLFDDRKASIVASGVFAPDEVRVLDRVLSAESLPRLKQSLDLLIPGKGARARQELVPAAFGLALSFKPLQTLAVIAASGSLNEFRRLQLLAPASPEAARFTKIIATKVDDYARTLATTQDHTGRGKAAIED